MRKKTRRVVALLCAAAVAVTGTACGLFFGVRFDITLVQPEHGTLYCTRTRARLFSSAVVCLYPQADEGETSYVPERITVNGVDYTEKLEHNRLTLRFIHEDLTICATFKPATGQSAFDAVFVAENKRPRRLGEAVAYMGYASSLCKNRFQRGEAASENSRAATAMRIQNQNSRSQPF